MLFSSTSMCSDDPMGQMMDEVRASSRLQPSCFTVNVQRPEHRLDLLISFIQQTAAGGLVNKVTNTAHGC